LRSKRTAALASEGVGIVAQEASAIARMQTTTKPDLNSASGFAGRAIGPARLFNG
jgi:hypothetical protein